MNYTVAVPEPIQHEISGLCLLSEVEEWLYERLANGIGEEELGECSRLPAPSPTYVWRADVDDPDNLGLTHYFTFYLTYGELDNTLYVRQCFYESKEEWFTEPEDEPPYPEHF